MHDDGREQEPNGLWTWNSVWSIVWKELRWFAKTLLLIAVSLGVGRVIRYITAGGVDIESLLRGKWHEEIDEAINARRKDDERKL